MGVARVTHFGGTTLFYSHRFRGLPGLFFAQVLTGQPLDGCYEGAIKRRPFSPHCLSKLQDHFRKAQALTTKLLFCAPRIQNWKSVICPPNYSGLLASVEYRRDGTVADVGGVRRTRRPSVRVFVPSARIRGRIVSAMCPRAPRRRYRVQRAGEEIAAANPCPALMLIYKQPITSGIRRRCVRRRPESRFWV
jgi:hypothetical protein